MQADSEPYHHEQYKCEVAGALQGQSPDTTDKLQEFRLFLHITLFTFMLLFTVHLSRSFLLCG